MDKETEKLINETTKKIMDDAEKIVNKTFNDINNFLKETFNSKTFKASIYLIKYIESQDKTYFDKYINIFKSLNFSEMVQVFSNVNVYFTEQQKNKNEISKHNKVKVKNKNE